MGLEPSLTAVVGIRIPKEEITEYVNHPKIIDGMDNDLVGLDGGEYNYNQVIVGHILYHYDGYGKTDVVKDLISEFASKRVEVQNEIEEEFGIIEREVSLYLVGACR